MNLIDNNTLAKIREFAIRQDWDKAFGTRSKGNKHLFRMEKIAASLARQLGADVSVARAGALLHDLALTEGHDYNVKRNLKIAQKKLGRFKLKPEAKKELVECIVYHEEGGRSMGTEASVVHDADVLEKSGVLGLIRHTWKMVNLGWLNPDKVSVKKASEVIKHIEERRGRLHTSLSREMHRKVAVALSENRTHKLIADIAKFAAKGLITEQIARQLRYVLTPSQQEKLASQLSLDYLKKRA